MRQLGVAEVDILRSFPTLRAVDLVQAISYVTHHRDEIEAAIQQNESHESEIDGPVTAVGQPDFRTSA